MLTVLLLPGSLATGVPAHAGGSEQGVASVAPVVALLLALLLGYVVGLARLGGRRPSPARGMRRIGPGRVGAFAAGCLALAVALLPPVDHWADERFSAHMLQHMLLIVVAAPLLASGCSGLAFTALLPVRRRALLARWRHTLRTSPLTGFLWLPVVAWLAHVLALWLWHMPGAYDAALRHDAVHAVEHASFLLTACWFWWHVLRTGRLRMTGGVAVLYVAAVSVPSAALGAVLTFASRPLYPEQALAAVRSGVDPLVDQQLAGLVMWVPANVVYLAVTVALFLPWLVALQPTDGRRERVLVAPEEVRR